MIISVLFSTAGIGWGQTPTIDDIVRLVRAQDDALDDQTAEVEIRSVEADGSARSSTHRLYWKNPRGAKGLLGLTLLVTQSPLHRKGESFLLWQAERAGESQAWLYLPDLRQALRVTIAGQDIQRPKRNAEMLLGFEQLGARLLGEAARAVVGHERLQDIDHVIVEEHLAGDADALRRFWVSPTNGTIAQIEYRGPGGRLDQTQTIEWQQVGRAWVWKRVEVRATRPPGQTIVHLREVSVNTGLSDRLFTVNALKSAQAR